MTISNPLIHPTTTRDIPDLTVVLDETGLFPSQMLPDLLAPALSGEGPALWLSCHVDGQAVGLCFCEPEKMTDGTWNMRALAVRPDLHGRGLGAALVAAAEQQLKAAGHRLLIIDTSGDATFAPARQFYSKLGYDQAARIRDFWAAGDDKVTFRKAL